MGKGVFKEENKRELEKELSDLSLLKDYISKTRQEDAEFSEIRDMDEFVMLDGGIRVPKIVMLEKSKGTTEILKRYSMEYGEDSIDELMQNTGLEKKDIMALMSEGLEYDEIEKRANNLPFKEISESAAIREMIKKEIDPEKMLDLKKRGIEVVPLKSGGIKVNGLEKIAEIDEKGLMKFSDDWFEKNLRPFEELGLIKISDKLVVKEIEEKGLQKSKNSSLEVVSLDKKKEEMTKEEIEKQEIAKELGEDPENIVSVIRIEDRDGGSKLFNHDVKGNSKPLIVRFKNNNFKLMEETNDGKKKELKGFDVTPVSKQVASLLKDTRDSLFTNLKPGEIKAGKTNPNQERYDIFQVRRAGESLDDDSNQLLYVGFSGKTDMNVIESRDNGDVRFAKTPISSIYPKSVYIENNIGYSGEKNITSVEQDNNKETSNNIKFNDIARRHALLKRLDEIEKSISKIEQDKQIGESDKEEKSGFDGSNKLGDLYSQRSEVLRELGVNESEAVRVEEEPDKVLGPKNIH